MATPNSSHGHSGYSRRRTSRGYLERKVLHSKHAHLVRTLRASEIVADLYSTGAIDSNDVERVGDATTCLEKNEIIVRELKHRRYPISELCEALDKCASQRDLAEDLRTAVEQKRKSYERKILARHGISPQVCRKRLTDAGMQFVLATTDLASILDRHPEALQHMKTALITITVLIGDEQVEAVIRSRDFNEAETATDFFRALAPVLNVLDEKTLETIVRASQVDEAIKRFEAYLNIRDPTVPLVVFESNMLCILHPPPSRSDAASVGAKELVVRTNRENLTVGDVAELRADVSDALNVSPLALCPRGVIKNSISVVFWVSERLLSYIQSQTVSLATLRFLHDEGIEDIWMDRDYHLIIPSDLCLEFWEACQDADVEVVPRCLDAGIDVDVASPSECLTGLMCAAQYGSVEVVRLLLARGADPNIQNTNGETALMIAVKHRQTKAAEVLRGEEPSVSEQAKDEVSAMELTREPPQSCEILEQQQGDELDSEAGKTEE